MQSTQTTQTTNSDQAGYSQALLSPQPAAALAELLANRGWLVFQVSEPDAADDGHITLSSDTAPVSVGVQVMRPGFGAPVVTTGSGANGSFDEFWVFHGKACLTLEVLLADIKAAIAQGAAWRGARD